MNVHPSPSAWWWLVSAAILLLHVHAADHVKRSPPVLRAVDMESAVQHERLTSKPSGRSLLQLKIVEPDGVGMNAAINMTAPGVGNKTAEEQSAGSKPVAGSLPGGGMADGAAQGMQPAGNDGKPSEDEIAGATESQEEEEGYEEEVPLAELLNKEDDEEAKAEQFSDVRVNFRSRRLGAAFADKKKKVLKQLQRHIDRIESAEDIGPQEKIARVDALKMTVKQVNATYNSYIKTINDMHDVLEQDFSDYDTLVTWQQKLASQQRKKIEDLQVQAMREHSALKEMEKNVEVINSVEQAKKEANQTEAGRNKISKVDVLLDTVGHAADDLQKFLDDHAFLKAQAADGATLMTVIKLLSKEDLPDENWQRSELSPEERRRLRKQIGDGSMSWLVDASNNQYVLSKPRDTTHLPEDGNLLNDIIRIVVACFVVGTVCQYLGLPSFVGHVFAGTLLGPSGLNVISSMVQISTMGEIGVFLVLFTLGLEFSIAQLRELFRVAVIGGTLVMLVTMALVIFLGSILQRPIAETVFVAIVTSLSSTTVAANNLRPKDHDQQHGKGLLGILLMQDVYLGVVMALLPMLGSISEVNTMDILFLIGKLLFSFLLLMAFSVAATKLLVERIVHKIKDLDASARLMCFIAVCFSMLKVTEAMQVSMELGCFVAGLMISVTGLAQRNIRHKPSPPPSAVQHPTSAVTVIDVHHTLMSQIIHTIEPVRDFFITVFFASVGMHVYPTFLAENAFLVFGMTAVVILLKYVAAFVVLLFTRSVNALSSHVIAIGLAQISEFAFVLAGRGKSLQLVGSPIYILMLSVTALTLLLSPLTWRAAILSLRIMGRDVST